MVSAKLTSAGHELSDGQWLDAHFECARSEYEASLRQVGIEVGWTVLDAGCGNGGFLPVLCELVGARGSVVGLDLAPENVALVEAKIRAGVLPANLRTQIGSVLALPFADDSFDCVWCANVAQYLTESEFARMAAEFQRVGKPGAMIAVKEYDSTLMQLHPIANDCTRRLWAARRAKAAGGALGPWCGTSVPSRLRLAGLLDISRKGWLVERWAPPSPATRAFVESFLPRWAGLAEQHNVPAADLDLWRELAANPSRILDDPDFCYREFFVVATGRVPG